ncbi:hypothetical protein J4219_00920 [Candidatus Woesearchaeota archaeon]|nr:hypothetical protein [Candidatus Woesearchaeota archaeon]
MCRLQSFAWLSFIFASSILLSAYVFPSPILTEDHLERHSRDNITYFSVPKSVPDKLADIGNIAGAIYEAAYQHGAYGNICFENAGTYVLYNGAVSSYDIKSSVIYNGKIRPLLINASPVCERIEGKEFTYQWNVEGRIQPAVEGFYTEISDQFSAYLTEVWWFTLLKFIVIFLSFAALCAAWVQGVLLIIWGVHGKPD